MEVIPLHWDTEFFGIRIAKAIASSEEDIRTLSQQEGILRNQFDLIYVFAEPDLDFSFRNARLVDKKAVFSLRDLKPFERSTAVVSWGSSKTPDSLISLALISGKYSRFKTDLQFPAGSYERLYTYWIEQSVNKTIATEVFCYMEKGQPRGLLTLRIHDCHGIIGLLAVDVNSQRHGIGTSLIKQAISYIYNHNGIHLSVATQMDNEPACKLYRKCGFSLETVTNIWHWWL